VDTRSRYRATIFYSVTVVENFSFVAVFYLVGNLSQGADFSFWLTVAASIIVSAGDKFG
jgi:XK-related protein